MTHEIDLLNISFKLVKYLFVLVDFYVGGTPPCGHFIMIMYKVKEKREIRRRLVQTPMQLGSVGRRLKGKKATYS